MIQVDNLSIAFRGNFLFDDLSFSLQTGEKMGLVGRNGSGKSTLFRLLMGKEKGAGTISMSKGYRLGCLDQHIHFSQPTLIEEALLALPEEERHEHWRVEKILFGLGFKESDMERSLGQFSGGYHLRLHLAKVLASEPDCLLLDEPTNYLDILSIRWLKRFLVQWPKEFILITHDREFMDSVTTSTLGLHRQKGIKVTGGTGQLFERILQEEEIYERTRQNLEKKKAHLEKFITRFGAKATKATQAEARKKMIAKMPALEALKELWNLQFSFKETPFLGQKMAEAKELSFGYPNQDRLIEHFSLTIQPKDRIAIIGKNGYGKSTLLRLLFKDLPPQSGSVEYSPQVRCGYFGQTHIDRLNPAHTIEEEISLANPLLNLTEIRHIAGAMLFPQEASQKQISFLSGGEKSRVLLAKILATPCNLLFLDEPTHHLDMESVEALVDALEEFSGAFIIVTHSELLLERLPLTQIVLCQENKQSLFLGDYQTFLTKEGWPEETPSRPIKGKEVLKPSPKKKPSFKIQQIEEKIILLEEELCKLQASLEEEGIDLKELQIRALRTEECKKAIDEAFIALEILYKENR